MEPLMKNRQWFIAIGLLVLVLAAVTGSILTSDFGEPKSRRFASRRSPAGRRKPAEYRS